MNRNLVRGGLLIALAVVLQALRLFIPVPLPVSTFFIGSLVHMLLLLSLRLTGLQSALCMGAILPCTAYLQGQLALPFLLPVVIMGNGVFLLLAGRFSRGWTSVLLPPCGKALFTAGMAWCCLQIFGLGDSKIAHGVIYAMSIPQFVTGVLGTLAATKMQGILQNKI